MKNHQDITKFLREYNPENAASQQRLFALVYSHLYSIAVQKMGGERADHTFTARDLLHEGFFKLQNIDAINWTSRSHFYKISAIAMRRVLIDHARRRVRKKRNEGDIPKVSMSQADRIFISQGPEVEEFITLYDGLEAFAAEHPNDRKTKVLDYYYFQGLEHADIAEKFGVSTKTIQRDLRKVETWLRKYFGLSSSTPE